MAALKTEMSSFYRDGMAHKAESIYNMATYRKGFTVPGLRRQFGYIQILAQIGDLRHVIQFICASVSSFLKWG